MPIFAPLRTRQGLGAALASKFKTGGTAAGTNVAPTSLGGQGGAPNRFMPPTNISQKQGSAVSVAPPVSAVPANPETVPQASAPTLPSVGASAAEVIYRNTITGASTTPISIPTTQDYKSLVIRMDVTVTSGTTAVPKTDILKALSNLEIQNSSGDTVKIIPTTDFYALYQRYSRYHSALSTTYITGTASTAVTSSATYVLPGFRLSQSGGPYTLVLTTPSATGGFGSDATDLSTLFTISVIPGLTGGVSIHAFNTTLNPQPVANGLSDLAPSFPFQGVALDELYLSNLTLNTADVSYWSIILNNQLVSNRVYSSDLVSQAQDRMTGTIPSGTLYLCFPLGTQIALNRSSHLWANYGSNPATSGVTATAVWYA